ncbi:MAG: phosphoribosylanthranilate isomerase [Gammaproteobacteria bacterium]|nr:phosphoribosylanthranilate isomerase [Rhodocyclaceae bacterium]MBU3909980.1 phosphoribosylanthranilate isomerase [Gammaproteobacteria bacterium]MBU3989086.1 phosphoribosylanthranilate isomerase [Gammaproteobacteria bacterium]MBU4003953.1 phosphoribosylanthranilate isomerase [Gammaproteobacteria bacterium]MBU4020200.1 phosphoribosylanthranilate isomerase [Gammaproteobacteria bacterium]
MHRTRIKICGITRAIDLDIALRAGVDALGFVFYPPSPRALSLELAADLVRRVPPFVTRVGLFVNAEPASVRETLAVVPVDLLQFHGEEDAKYCEQFGLPYLKAARVRPELDLLEFARAYPSAQGLLVDAWVEAYGGVGQSFDWTLIPQELPLPLVLSGGLHADNVAEAVAKIRPWAVDVSSGVEVAKGIKDADKIAAFVAAVRTENSSR